MTASADRAPGQTRRVGERGLTLIELLVATAIFVMLGLGVVTMVAGALKVWRSFEYRRNAYEAAQWVFGLQARDLAAAYTREPMGVDLIKARFLVDRQGPGGTPRLMFVRTIESGPERAVTYFSGGGGSEYYNYFDDDSDGRVDNRLRPLGGLAEVVYYVKGGTLYRGVRSPVGDAFTDIVQSGRTVPVADNVLHFDVALWTQYTNTWDESAKPTMKVSAARGAERVWDSTRGLLRDFLLYRGTWSLADPGDDVFPEKLRVTLVVEGDDREFFTTLREDLTDTDGVLRVADTRGFPSSPDEGPMYVKVRDEWIRYSEKGARQLLIAQDGRGARGTARALHPMGSRVKRGHTFTAVLYVPTFKEDWSDDREAARRAGVPYIPR